MDKRRDATDDEKNMTFEDRMARDAAKDSEHFARSATRCSIADKLMEFSRADGVLAIRGLHAALIDAAIALDDAFTRSQSRRVECEGYSKGHATDLCGNCGKSHAEHTPSSTQRREAPPGMRWLLVEDKAPLKADDLDAHGALFGLRFVPGCSNGCVELYVEDDENWHFKMSFDKSWLPDLARVAGTPSASGEKKP